MMELIRINEKKLKIMLTPSDMEHFEISDDALERGDAHTRGAFREILGEVRTQTGFDTEGSRVYIQYYPSRHGGCELFVTVLGRMEDRDRAALSAGKGVGVCPVGAEAERGDVRGDRRRSVAYAFVSLPLLLAVCRRLSRIPHRGESAAYRGEDGTWYLFLFDMNELPSRTRLDPYAFLTEYGRQENSEVLLLYIKEHASPICEHRAVDTLSGL